MANQLGNIAIPVCKTENNLQVAGPFVEDFLKDDTTTFRSIRELVCALAENLDGGNNITNRHIILREVFNFSMPDSPEKSENFVHYPNDGRSKRIFLPPNSDTKSHTYRFLSSLGEKLGINELENLGVGIQIKGTGCNFPKTENEIISSWDGPEDGLGLTTLDTGENIVAGQIGARNAGRILLASIKILGIEPGSTLSDAFGMLEGDRVVNIYVTLGGPNLRDIAEADLETYEKWELALSVGRVYFGDRYQEVSSETGKKNLASGILKKVLTDFAKIQRGYTNRSSQNTGLMSIWDFDTPMTNGEFSLYPNLFDYYLGTYLENLNNVFPELF